MIILFTLCWEQKNSTSPLPATKPFTMSFPVPLAKSLISVSTTESAVFQLGSMAGGEGKSAFPFPDSILKLTALLNILHQPGG